jgi:PIN domain nuclease of toxin-antitoxin system
MKLLLDTHAFIWWDSTPDRLSERVQDMLQDASHDILFSIVSAWEMQIKHQLGKLELRLPLGEIIEEQCRINMVDVLPVELEHVLALDSLPALHSDPFDRLLIAQANVAEASLVSSDTAINQYPVRTLW